MNSLSTTGKSYALRDGLSAGKVVNYYSVAHLPLNLLSDFFSKLPLVKGAFIKITLNLNCNTKTTMEIDAQGRFTSVSSSSQFGQVPYQISPIGDGNGLNIASITPVTKMELSIGVARNSINSSGTTFSHPTLSSVRVYAALYDLTPQVESMYLSKMPTKVIKYKDFLSFQTLNISPNSNFNQILTNSISRGRRLIGVPQIAAAFNYAGNGGVIAPANSPFSTSPNTTANGAITNFNVLVSGTNLWQQNLNYSSENFIHELRKTSAINDGLSLGMSSGLINQLEYEAGYRFIVADLSRTPSEASDNIAKSIQVIGSNTSGVPIDILWFLEFEREIEIDIGSGNLIS
jgi:hypothetical protein